MDGNHIEAKLGWRKDIFEMFEEGQELGLPDKVKIAHFIDKFVDDYIKAQGRIPEGTFGDLYLFYGYIAPYGYVIPTIEEDIDYDITQISKFAERKGVKIVLKRPIYQNV